MHQTCGATLWYKPSTCPASCIWVRVGKGQVTDTQRSCTQETEFWEDFKWGVRNVPWPPFTDRANCGPWEPALIDPGDTCVLTSGCPYLSPSFNTIITGQGQPPVLPRSHPYTTGIMNRGQSQYSCSAPGVTHTVSASPRPTLCR